MGSMSETADSVVGDIAAIAAAPKADTPKAAKSAKPAEWVGVDDSVNEAFDSAIENMSDKLRERSDLPKREKKEQPKAVESEQSEDAPEVEGVAEPEGEAATEAPKEEKKTDYALERALAALRFAKVPSEVIDTLGRAKLLEWGSQLAEAQAKTAEKIRSDAEELKRAQESKKETTAKAESDTAPAVDADFTSSLEAFKEYGEDFQKGQSAFARAIYQKARDDMRGEIQPAAAMLLEMRSLMEEVVSETLDREARERFPGLVEGEKASEAKAAFKRLWGKSGESYADAAPTILGRLRAAQADAYKLLQADQPAPRKDDSQKKAQRIPASPSRTMPRKAMTPDEEMDSAIEESMARWKDKS